MFKKIRSIPKFNRALIIIESSITASLIHMPFMSIFFESEIGLSCEQISIVQALYTVVVLVLNVSLGWLADRFSRKFCNVAGDLLCFASSFLYPQINTMSGCILCEVIFGIGAAFSQGVDHSLLRHFSNKEDLSSGQRLYKESSAKLATVISIVSLLYYVIGFAFGDLNPRKIMTIGSIPFLLGTIASLLIEDDSVRPQNTPSKRSKNTKAQGDQIKQKCILDIFKDILFNNSLNIRTIAYVLSREITHAIIWFFTPILEALGVTGRWVAIAWLTSNFSTYIGTLIARKASKKLPEWANFAIPIAAIGFATIVLTTKLSILTLPLYCIFGITQGWTRVSMMPNLTAHADEKYTTTVNSVAKTCSGLYYIPAAWVVGRAADINLNYAFIATFLLFIPAAIPTAIRLKQQEESEKQTNEA